MNNVTRQSEAKRRIGRGYMLERQWRAQLAGLGSRRARSAFHYEAYVPLPIGDQDFLLTSQVASAAANAEAACRELNENPPGLRNLENLARQLLRAESVASSRIEGLVLSHRRLARAAFSPDHDLNAKSVLGNIAALERAIALAGAVDVLTTEDILEVHRELFAGTRDERFGGVLRTEQNWIGGDASSPRTAEFVPPPPEYVRPLIDDLCDFLNRDDVPAAIQAAIAHAQFETIHPFADGNGRVGRTLIQVVLNRRHVATRYFPPVSLVLAASADRYIAGLTNWRFNDESEDWLLLFSDAVWRAARGAREFAEAVTALQQEWIDRAGNPRRSSAPLRLIEILPSRPIIDIQTAAQLLDISSEAARQAVLRLEEAGVLREFTLGRRNRAWETVGLFDLLDSFERELGPDGRTPHPTH